MILKKWTSIHCGYYIKFIHIMYNDCSITNYPGKGTVCSDPQWSLTGKIVEEKAKRVKVS